MKLRALIKKNNDMARYWFRQNRINCSVGSVLVRGYCSRKTKPATCSRCRFGTCRSHISKCHVQKAKPHKEAVLPHFYAPFIDPFTPRINSHLRQLNQAEDGRCQHKQREGRGFAECRFRQKQTGRGVYDLPNEATMKAGNHDRHSTRVPASAS